MTVRTKEVQPIAEKKIVLWRYGGCWNVTVNVFVRLEAFSCCDWVITGIHCHCCEYKLYDGRPQQRSWLQTFQKHFFKPSGGKYFILKTAEYLITDKARRRETHLTLHHGGNAVITKSRKSRTRHFQMILTFKAAKRRDWCRTLTSNLQISQILWLMGGV